MASKETYGAIGKNDLFYFDPEDLFVAMDPAHPLYDERVKLPLNEDTIASIMRVGVLEPILIRKNGTTPDGRPLCEVEDGRRRTLHCREANRRLIKLGKDPIRIAAVIRRDTDEEAFGVSIEANEHRDADPPMFRARKMQRCLNMGQPEKQVASRFRCSVQTVKNSLELLALTPTLQTMVDAGKLGVVLARRIATSFPKDQQEAELAKVATANDAARDGDFAAVAAAPTKERSNADVKRALDKAIGDRGKVRARVMKGRAEMEAFRESLLASKSDTSAAAAATIAWVLGQEEPFADHPVLRKRLAGLDLEVE